MAEVAQNVWGLVFVLDHEETEAVTSVAVDVAEVAYRLGEMLADTPLALAGYILEAVALGIAANVIAIELADVGNGVYLTTPWVALGTIIPTTRPMGIGMPANWVTRGSGTFSTEDAGDLISYEIQRDAIGPEAVEFRLRSNEAGMWRKVLVIRDGLGSQWDIAIDPSQGTFSAVNGLWADQVRNGQSFSLWKAKEVGVMTWVLDFKYLELLPAGSRVVFTWWRDH